MSGFNLALGLLLVSALYGLATGMWRGAGGGFHFSMDPLLLGLVTLLGLGGLLELAGVTVFRAAFPGDFGAYSVSFFNGLLPYIIFYVVYTRLPTDRHVLLTSALFDRLYDGVGVRRAYRRRVAGKTMGLILQENHLGPYR